jgi:hypothetical protein
VYLFQNRTIIPGKEEMIMRLRTCVSPDGAICLWCTPSAFHRRQFPRDDGPADLGRLPDGGRHRNTANFPAGPVHEPAADWIFEVPNAFPFRGTTYIGKTWADARAANPEAIGLPEAPALSFFDSHA